MAYSDSELGVFPFLEAQATYGRSTRKGAQTKVLFLGHLIGVIQMDQEKIRSVVDWEVAKKEKNKRLQGPLSDILHLHQRLLCALALSAAELAGLKLRWMMMKT
ncbi:hypothetical protein M569_00076 [Genlisea aurea]|uniref:Uncharacterized protein n=1 Tax=Genlisea aurea TaxID=192259 RepID=S8DB10_9LAMI|nr:hypothetical protein M569_00076 [Genlisea aurea]